jgi:hypothetical protein
MWSRIIANGQLSGFALASTGVRRARLDVRDELSGNVDVVLQQRGQGVPGLVAVVAGDGVADVVLVGEEARERRIGVEKRCLGGRRADDVLAGPHDVVLPEASHLGPECVGRYLVAVLRQDVPGDGQADDAGEYEDAGKCGDASESVHVSQFSVSHVWESESIQSTGVVVPAPPRWVSIANVGEL